MKPTLLTLFTAITLTSCQTDQAPQQVITSDIDRFWEAYDLITATDDSVLQYGYLDSLYFDRGTAGLEGIRQARNYTAQEYIDAINNYPRFWNSVRENTQKADAYREEIRQGIERVGELYPEVKPNKIYFTIGAMRTGGTYLDSMALIGSEMAFADENTVAAEFPEAMRAGRQTYFDQNPLDDVVFLAVQEFVHTQQKPFVHNLLSYCLHEGVGDFVSYTALNLTPDLPAITYGKSNDAVREKFEKEMFYINNRNKWLWSDAPNEFGVRDLGYYIGYQLCENYYNQAADKKEAIRTMIELDYEDDAQIEDFVHTADFFSATLDELYENFESKRPYVTGIAQFENNSDDVSPQTKEITVRFSRPLNGYNTGVDFGDLGEEAFPKNDINGRYWSEDHTAWTIPVELEPDRTYQLFITNNFRTEDDIPLKAYLIEFKTGGR
jgi:hypothetical protein